LKQEPKPTLQERLDAIIPPDISYIGLMPNEIILEIFSWLTPIDFNVLFLVSKLWNNLANNEEIWKSRTYQEHRGVHDMINFKIKHNSKYGKSSSLFTWKTLYFRYRAQKFFLNANCNFHYFINDAEYFLFKTRLALELGNRVISKEELLWISQCVAINCEGNAVDDKARPLYELSVKYLEGLHHSFHDKIVSGISTVIRSDDAIEKITTFCESWKRHRLFVRILCVLFRSIYRLPGSPGDWKPNGYDPTIYEFRKKYASNVFEKTEDVIGKIITNFTTGDEISQELLG